MNQKLYRIGRVVACATLLAACSQTGSGGGALPNPAAKRQSLVAVYGDSQLQLRQAIATAVAAKRTPVYVTVRASKRSYEFPVYGQVTRSRAAIIVRAYQRIYVFAARGLEMRYGSENVKVGSLPAVSAPRLDRLITDGRLVAGRFTGRAALRKYHLCPDCVRLVVSKRIAARFGRRWNGLLDPWQRQPRYVAWAPAPDSATPPPNICGSAPCVTGTPSPGGICSSIGFSSSNDQQPLNERQPLMQSSGGCIAMSGPSGAGPAPGLNPPNPCLTVGDRSVQNLVNNGSLDGSMLNVLSNVGGDPTISDTASLPVGQAARATASSILWDSTNVSAAVNQDGQSAAEILFHELGHVYLDEAGIPLPVSEPVNVAIGGYTISYNLNDPAAVAAYQHLIINNWINELFEGGDGTAAGYQMLGVTGITNHGAASTASGVTVTGSNGAVVAPSGLVGVGNQLKGKVLPVPDKPLRSLRSDLKKYGSTCAKAPATRRLRPQTLLPSVGEFNSIYSVNT